MKCDANDGFNVLIVDDAPGDIVLAKLALAEGPFPCQVQAVGNGEEAIALMLKQPPYRDAPTPDLVLLDLNMPQMNGMEVLAEMRAKPNLCTIPVVVLTTSDSRTDISAAYQLGARGYLSKPVDVGTLFKKIQVVKEYWFNIVQRPG